MENLDLLMEKYKNEMMEISRRAVNIVNSSGTDMMNEAERNSGEDVFPSAVRNGEEHTGTGKLKINVFTGNEAFPVISAAVEVYDGDSLLFSGFTDNSGAVSELYLPAPSADVSKSPGKQRGYSTYKVRVSHPGFNGVVLENVPVFEGIESVQPVSLEPASASGTETIRETEPFSGEEGSYA